MQPNSQERRMMRRFDMRLPAIVRLEGKTDVHTETQNVSARGARVLSVRRWNINDHLSFESLPGDFRAKARVAYCVRLRDDGYAVGVEFLEPVGHWVLGPLSASGNNLHG